MLTSQQISGTDSENRHCECGADATRAEAEFDEVVERASAVAGRGGREIDECGGAGHLGECVGVSQVPAEPVAQRSPVLIGRVRSQRGRIGKEAGPADE
ncbi:hypothetical protein ACFWNN_02205 [Lentzea sp. NPDC058450]|uniref:hypothetical protein n=1 Tax=Lentzea sp. NPDC058450 TaxID=3346505 RepID=UPI00365ECB29